MLLFWLASFLCLKICLVGSFSCLEDLFKFFEADTDFYGDSSILFVEAVVIPSISLALITIFRDGSFGVVKPGNSLDY